ncbi:hypothetical protein FNF27_05377 [Cafeteria roenbergensis]|uniref:Hyaluronidase n=1 Tax=Cafeteria roenbergensis TaxID=33653 RepID=A0A5A8DW49_CAFRO|nr:hypothetical protein FNF29_01953 [Cafeteria roenbergensis]KAA0169656.1 hypothetical protein FNF28_01933 [Cafeteria roenbergensis]KAA0173153.1 hypothetical protein FNF27_05377 [Cafeteria roenbergensis]|eukprot:KAA0155203.1 hypothetical protein FNF29_01953 [Cafeteria roenbergensis]
MARRLAQAAALYLAATSAAQAYELLWNVAGADGIDLTPFPLIKQGQLELFTTYLGMLPVIQASGRWCNGGLPQLANVTRHVAKVRRDVLARISPSFGGLVVVDYEAWTGSWNSTQELYRNASIALAAVENPSLPPSQLEGVAIRTFNKAAQAFLVATLDAVRAACPSCRVGLYGYPIRAYWNGYCSPSGPRLRNESNSMLPVFAASDALFPSIYQFYPKESRARNKQYVDCNVGEAVRLSKLFSPPKPVYAYGWPRYHTGSGALLDSSDTDLEFAEPGRITGAACPLLPAALASLRPVSNVAAQRSDVAPRGACGAIDRIRSAKQGGGTWCT